MDGRRRDRQSERLRHAALHTGRTGGPRAQESQRESQQSSAGRPRAAGRQGTQECRESVSGRGWSTEVNPRGSRCNPGKAAALGSSLPSMGGRGTRDSEGGNQSTETPRGSPHAPPPTPFHSNLEHPAVCLNFGSRRSRGPFNVQLSPSLSGLGTGGKGQGDRARNTSAGPA